MLDNPFKRTTKPESISLQKEQNASFDQVDDKVKAIEQLEKAAPESIFDDFEPLDDRYEYTPSIKQFKLDKRDVSKELDDEQYQARLDELNNNAENKHYVLFFGSPASGKTWIIGSILHYMKSYIEGTAHLDTSKTTESEEELFYLLQDRFNRVTGSQKITSTDTTQYFELHISFKPKDTSKPKIEIVFIDASGEHSQQSFRTRGKVESGKLPNYLTVILESKVNTKIAFVYDQSLADQNGVIAQINVLNAVFTQVELIQQSQNKYFPKVLLLSKADLIYARDMAAVERNGYDPMLYAIDKIPGFANSFFNESPDNKTIFYKMGTFSVNSDLILEFDKECPEKFFRWLYAQSTGGISPIKEANCWDKFKRWLKGS
ncbi:TRAFAC clade GTPase domain-containing protein [Histophilus somni]|uniref:TRAFAC clade GTPase domain-containing protein n=1 Tax=Histophilus somni TaxID=731 RepID=UPI001F0D04DB|nr:ribonucleoside-triphosphate reductase [Histophilus somni]